MTIGVNIHRTAIIHAIPGHGDVSHWVSVKFTNYDEEFVVCAFFDSGALADAYAAAINGVQTGPAREALMARFTNNQFAEKLRTDISRSAHYDTLRENCFEAAERLQTRGYPIILGGDHAEFERENANIPPEQRPDWPLPSFDAVEWAKAFCKLNPTMDEGLMITWFANALMRGYDERISQETKP